MTADDVVCALEALRALVKDPVTKVYALRLDFAFFQQYVETYEKKEYPKIEPNALIWVPYVMGRNNTHYENAPIQTIAQRDDGVQAVPEEGVQLAASDVNIRDFAVGRNSTSGDESSSADAENQNQTSAARATPSAEPKETESLPLSSRQTPVTPTTPYTKAHDTNDLPIPATRFEVWPPSPSTQRRRAGRGGGRWSTRRNTPLRRTVSGGESPTTRSKPSTARRTRSTLAEMMNGQSDNGDAEGEEEVEDGHLQDEDEDEDAGTKGFSSERRAQPAHVAVENDEDDG